MTRRELDAAGVHNPALRAAYQHARQVNAQGGKTYFLATRLLTPERRPAIHALYGFARHADDIVDAIDATRPADRASALDELERALRDALRTGRSSRPVLAALAHTVSRYEIEAAHFDAFLRSMRMDLTVTDYASYAELRRYMHGSAAVIGLQVLPVLGAVAPRERAAPHAASLGVAFQLTNFLRDVGEDLERGRVYLPADVLSAHGVDRDRLWRCRRAGRTDAPTRAALRELAALNREIYRHAAAGIPMLSPVSRPCVRAAYLLYQRILDELEAADWPSPHRRVAVGNGRRLAAAARGAGSVALARCSARLRKAGA